MTTQEIVSAITDTLNNSRFVTAAPMSGGKTGVQFCGKAAVRIKLGKKAQYLELSNYGYTDEELGDDESPFIREPVLSLDDVRALGIRFNRIWEARLDQSIDDRFGCCSSFKECSDARHCLYEDDLFYYGCYYKANLDAGRIFYGANANTVGVAPFSKEVPTWSIRCLTLKRRTDLIRVLSARLDWLRSKD